MVHYSGFWRRVCANIIDGLILFIPMEIIYWLVFMYMVGTDFRAFLDYEFGYNEAVYLGYEAVGLLLTTLLSLFYYAKLHSSSMQATIGKRLFGIQVTTVEGERLSFMRAVGRYLAMFLSALPFGLGFLMAAFTKKKQALHDYAAKTIVTRKA